MLSAIQDAGGSSLVPRGVTYAGESQLLWTHVAADTLIWVACWAVVPTLVYLVVRAAREVPEGGDLPGLAFPRRWVLWAFGTFWLAAGATHFLEVWTVWQPWYWVSGGVKMVTAMASVATAVALPPLVPRVLRVIRDARAAEPRRRRLEEAQEELETAYRRLQEAEQARADFFANVSHELRTPLTLILGPVRELLDESGIPEEDRRTLRTVESNARTLLGQVNDLLDLARMEAGALPLRLGETELTGIVREAAANFQMVARSQDVRFELHAPRALPALVDRGKVERILLNLLSNAFKFTPEGGVVVCRLERDEAVAAQGGDRGPVARIVVEDSGPGVPAEDRERVFDRYRRAGREPRTEPGEAGLGLAIVREFSTALGGSAWVEESDLGGARFLVLLPLREPEPGLRGAEHGEAAPEPEGLESRATGRQAGQPPAPAADPPAPAGTVLVVDDNRDLCAYLARTLGSEYRVYVAHDGLQGLRRALEVRPDLILADVMMPVMTGDELLREASRHEALADVPVIVLTARADGGLPARLLEAGAMDYLVKPVEAAELRSRVRNTLDLTRTRHILERETGTREGRLQELASQVGRSRRELQAALQDKRLAIQELHHRVKGNLQTISSLLNLQMRRVEDPAARTALHNARGRILAMGLIHERLYRDDDATRLAMPEYLRRLAAMTARAHLDRTDRVHVNVRCPALSLPADQAIPCGLLVYEVLSNALNHGFPGDREGRVDLALSLQQAVRPRIRITVHDDGVGMDAEARSSGLGLELVEALARQLGGTVEIDTDRGTTVELLFPLEGP